MKMKRRFYKGFARMLTLLFAVSSFFPAIWQGTAAYAEESYKISASVAKSESEVVLTISIADNEPQLDGLQFNIEYDQKAFSLERVDDCKLIGQNTQFSSAKDVNPYFCSWYVGTSAKPAQANGKIADFVFKVKDSAAKGNYSFAVKDIQGFYNTVETVDGQKNAVEKKIKLSTVRAEIALDDRDVETLYTYEEAKIRLEQEAEKVNEATETAMWNALEAYDAKSKGYSKDAAENVYKKLYEDANSALEQNLSLRLKELGEAENYNQSVGQGGQSTHNISQMLREIQACEKSESYFAENASEDALRNAENSLTESLDGKRIITVAAGENLLKNFTSAGRSETLYFNLEIAEDGVYGFDTVYKSEEACIASEDKVELAGIYKKVGERYKKLEYEMMGTGNYITEDAYTVRYMILPYENQSAQDFLEAGDSYVFAITLHDGFRPQELKMMSYDYAKCKVVAGEGGTIIYSPHRVGDSGDERDLPIVDWITSGGAIGIAHDGYVFDGLYIGDKKLETRHVYGGEYYCYAFSDENGNPVSVNDFWMFENDIYFQVEEGKQFAEFTAEQLKYAGLEGVNAEYLEGRDIYRVTLEDLMEKIGAIQCIIKSHVWQESFDLGNPEIQKKAENIITAKFRPFLYGDVDGNGTVDYADVLCIKRYLAEWDNYGDANNVAADLDQDGKVTIADVEILERHIAGWTGYKTLPKVS